MYRFLIVAAGLCFCAAAKAQTKINGTTQCAKPDPMHVVSVGDRPDHSFGVSQSKCTGWTKPLEIGSDKSKEGVSTETADISGKTSKIRGVHVETMESGDKFYVWYSGTATSKEGAPPTAKGTWGFTGGTGKLKGIKGKGTYDCAPSGDTMECKVEGEYELAK